MKSLKYQFFYLIFVLFLTKYIHSAKTLQGCSCNGLSTPLPDNNFIQGDQIINGINYNKSSKIGSMVGLGKIFLQKIYSTYQLDHSCPAGTIPLTRDQLQDLITNNYNEFYSYLERLGVVDGLIILSSTKASTIVDNSNVNAYSFFGSVKAKVKMSITSENLIYKLSKVRVVCIFDEKKILINTSDYDYKVKTEYQLESTSKHIQSTKWYINNSQVNGRRISFKFPNEGDYTIKISTLDVFNNYKCYCGELFAITYSSQLNNYSVSDLLPSNINLHQSEFNAEKEYFSFFNKGNGPIAPKNDGGFYMSYSDTSYNAFVVEFDENMNIIKTISIEQNAFILDIVTVPEGFVIYMKYKTNNDKSVLQRWNKDGTLVWNRNVMNNRTPDLSPEVPPSQVVDQVSFFDMKNKRLIGNELMFANQGGKLSYAHKKLSLNFSHYNHFGYLSNGSRNDHTGDSHFIFSLDNDDLKTGYGWTWGASHSLVQLNFYDGKHFVTANLGEPFPENIRVCFTYPDEYNISKYDPVRKTLNNNLSYCFDNLIDGKIPGDGRGKTCGFLGGLSQINDDYVLTYSRKACEMTSYNGIDKTFDYNNDVGVVFFKFDTVNKAIVNRRQYNISSGGNVKGLKSVTHGDKLVVFLTVTDTPTAYLKSPEHVITTKDRTEYMLIDSNGKVIRDRTKFDADHIVPVSDQIKTLMDGKKVWTYLSKSTGKLKIAYINPLK